MHRAFLYFAFLAFCSAAPYGDLTATRTIVPPPQPEQPYAKSAMPVFSERRDETDLVDTSASGYSYFRHQPIGLRPIEEQRVAISEPFLRTDDSSNQYANYAKSSAFKTLPAQNQYAADLTRTIISPEQGPYGSALSQSQPDTRVLHQQGYGQDKVLVNNGYGSQIQPDNRFLPQQGYGQDKVLVRNGYGSQVQPDNRFLPQQGYGQDKVLVNNGYGSQIQTDTRVLPQQGYGQDKVLVNNGYGSQVQPDNRVLHQQGYGQDKVLVNNGYGSQVQPDNRVLPQQGYGQERLAPSTIRVVSNGYGQPQVEEKTVITIKSNNGYGSQAQPDNRVLHQQGYGQDKVLVNNGYGSQVQPDTRVLLQQGYGQEKLAPPTITVVSNGYGQPQIEEKTFISVKSNNGYGSQVVPDNRVLPQQGYGQQRLINPMIKTLNSGYGQQEN